MSGYSRDSQREPFGILYAANSQANEIDVPQKQLPAPRASITIII